jgi:SP family xylose:H+ symportor-like MFS transporter
MSLQPQSAIERSSYAGRICLIAAVGGLLFGYDTAVINGSIGFLQAHFSLSAAMTGWAASSALLGCVLGVALAGPSSDRWGRKFALVASGVLFLVSSIGTALPSTLLQFILFRILAGVGVGIASMASPMYIAEVAPADIRGRLVSVNQLAIVTGMLLIYFVNYFVARQGDAMWRVETSWRWMFASGIVPSGIFLGLLFFAPESPRWLLQRGKSEEALLILDRIGGGEFAKNELQEFRIVADNAPAQASRMFTRSHVRLLALGLALAVLQQITGINVFLYFGTEIFKKLGSSVDTALLETVAVGAVNLVFTVVAIGTVDRIGRRPLMILGAAGMGLCLAAMGLMAEVGTSSAWALAPVLGYIAFFALSVGPVTWVILSEIFPTAIRGRGLALASFGLWVANFIVSQTFPIMDENGFLVAHFHHAFPFLVFSLMCGVLILVTVKWVPETKGKSLEDIEITWALRHSSPEPIQGK